MDNLRNENLENSLKTILNFKWDKADYAKYINILNLLADEKYKAFHSKIVPDISSFIGITIPIMDKISKSIIKTDFQNYFNCFLKNNTQTYEEKTINGFVIANSGKNFSLDFIKDKINFQINLIDNWASCDCFCARLKIIKKNPSFFEDFVYNLCYEKNIFRARVGFVLLLDYYINEQNLSKIFTTLKDNPSDEYYIMMAQSWLISAIFVKFPNETIKFLNENFIPVKTHNVALQKIRDSKRVDCELKQLTKTMIR